MNIQNKKAYYDYFILKEFEAGIVLQGTEIKSLRKNSTQLKDSYVVIRNKEAYLLNLFIAKYEEGNQFNHEETRTRKLLLHKKEIKKLKEETEKVGYSLIPLKMYLKKGKVKILIGLAKGKKVFDKRESLKKKAYLRETKNLI